MTKYYGEDIDNAILKGVDKNAYSFVDDSTKDFNDYTALTYFNTKITYGEFKKKVNEYANNLLKYGLQVGDSITLLLPNTPEIVYYYYAAWVLGVKVSPIDPRTNPLGIQKIINDTNSKLLVAILDKYVEKISPIIDNINVDKIVIVSPTDSMSSALKTNIGKALYKSKEIYLNIVDKDFASDKIIMNKNFINNKLIDNIIPFYEKRDNGLPAVNLFTSGTEGTPKTAVHSHENYNIKARQILYGLPRAVPGDKFLGIIPFFSAYGSFQGMHNCLYRGMNIILIPQFKPADVPELICKYTPSTVIAVPNYWHDFSDRIDLLMKKYGLEDLSFLKYPISGGDKQSAIDVKICNEILKKYKSQGMLLRGYGSTEVGGATATTVDDESYEDNEYTGVPFPGVDFKLIKNNPDNEYSELYVSDPSMMIGYLNNDEETKRTIITIDDKKYVRMGDLFSADEKDRLYFEGRVKRAIMRPDGHTVHVLPIEETLNQSPYVSECCVVGLKKNDGSAGTIPTAFIVLKNNVKELGYDEESIVNDLDKLSLENLSERNRALAYVFIKDLPRTLMDKVDFKKLEKMSIDDLELYYVDDMFVNNSKKVLKKRKRI